MRVWGGGVSAGGGGRGAGGGGGTWFYVAGMGGGYEYNNNVFGILCADGTTKAKLIMRSYESNQIIFEFVYPARKNGY